MRIKTEKLTSDTHNTSAVYLMLSDKSRSSYHVSRTLGAIFIRAATFRVIPRSRVKRAKITRRSNEIKSTRRPVICENVHPSVAAALQPAVFV